MRGRWARAGIRGRSAAADLRFAGSNQNPSMTWPSGGSYMAPLTAETAVPATASASAARAARANGLLLLGARLGREGAAVDVDANIGSAGCSCRSARREARAAERGGRRRDARRRHGRRQDERDEHAKCAARSTRRRDRVRARDRLGKRTQLGSTRADRGGGRCWACCLLPAASLDPSSPCQHMEEAVRPLFF